MYDINEILIIPAKFSEFENNETCIIDCLIGEDNQGNPIIENRRFENVMVEQIKNPTYLFIGIMQGESFAQIMFTDAKEYKDMFEEKWGSLTV
jgi:hypothetical protein